MYGVALAFSRIGFLNMLAFRLRYYTGVFNYLINVTVYYFIWRAIFHVAPGFGGFTFPQMITYVAVGWIIRSMYFNNIDSEMAEDILEGRITMTMVRPVSVQLTYVARSVGESAFRLLLLSAPTALVLALIFPVLPPASWAHFAVFLASLAGSVLLVGGLNFIVGACAIQLTSILGLLRAKFWVQDLLSGATHNQRGRGTIAIEVGTGYEVPLDTIIEIVEESMSSKIYELLKRTDEAVVVETAHKNPKFVEDCVRVMAHKVVEAFPYLPDDSIITIKQLNEESIHRHNAFAERVASLEELRQELALEHEVEVKAICET